MKPRKITPLEIMKGEWTFRLSEASRFRRKKRADPRARSAQTMRKSRDALFMSY
jgi:hypothetical protein